MSTQSYQNHTQRVPVFMGAGILSLLIFIGGCVNVYKSMGDHQRLYSATLVLALSGCVLVIGYYARTFALKAQDRAIRAEEALRHFMLTGKALDNRLTIKQIVALRFAGDDEFPALALQAAEQGTTPGEIKQAIKYWRADTYRV